MKHWLISAILMAVLAGASAAEEIDGRTNGQLLKKPFQSVVTGEDRNYLLYLPKGYETEAGRQWPVLLFLHGGGERGDGNKDLEALLEYGPLKEVWVTGRDLPFIIISPQMPPFDETARQRLAESHRDSPRYAEDEGPPMTRTPVDVPRRWGQEGPPQGWWVYEKDVMSMVDATLKEYRADPDRVYITGLSYGGYGTWHLAAAYPDRWAAAAPICGVANMDTLPRIAEAKLPIWIITGGRDRTVLPEWVLASAIALEKAGHPSVRLTVHEDLPHDSWTRMYTGWDLYNWLLMQRRGQ
jgi:predicted peptidase